MPLSRYRSLLRVLRDDNCANCNDWCTADLAGRIILAKIGFCQNRPKNSSLHWSWRIRKAAPAREEYYQHH